MARLLLVIAAAALLLTVPASAERGSTNAFLGMARPSALVLVDANLDGKVDVLSANVQSSMSFFLGVGDGSLAGYAMSPLQGSHPDLATADFNADGRPDYVVARYAGGVSVFLGSNSGVYTPTRYSTPAGVIGVLAADFNRDGKADVAALSSRQANLTVMLGNGDGTFGSGVRYRVGRSRPAT
jgi:FG-GAP-like repeat